MARKLKASDYELAPMLRALFRSAAFYDPAIMGARIKSPVELVVGTIRDLGLPASAIGYAEPLLQQMGHVLFQPPNVKGWDGGRAWINASTLLARYNFATHLIERGRWLAANERAFAQQVAPGLPPAMRAEIRRFGFRNAELLFLPILRQVQHTESAEAALDHLLARLLARPLDKPRRAQLLTTLAPAGSRFDPDAYPTRWRLLQTVRLILSLPEYQLG